MGFMEKPIALDPGVGGCSIGVGALAPADIVVSTTDAGMSGVIRVGSRAVVSHAALYAGSGSMIEAIRQGVVSRPLDDSLADDKLAVAYRHPDVTPRIAQAVVAYASAQIRKRYDLVGAGLAQGLICLVRDGKQTAFFCSELVMEAFKQAGVPLGTMPSQCYTPGDVAEIGIQRLIYVGHLKGNTAWFPKLSP